jgi:hypothetical protein
MPIHGHFPPKAMLGPCFSMGSKVSVIPSVFFPLPPPPEAAETKGKSGGEETALDLPGVNARA